jgi:peptidoglycan/xylan/chitin deacetylase (PgdA/CDA1 family)
MMRASPLVLAYHGVGEYPRHLDPRGLMLDPARFRRQIESVMRRGYRFLSLSDFTASLEENIPPPDRVCAVTFDDGTSDQLELIAPLLADLEVPATYFVCPGLLGEPHFAFPAAAGVRMMRPDELRTLASMPFTEIGSHTATHADLSQASDAQAHGEMVDSKEALEELLQLPITSFAYPKCLYSSACPDAARRAGYTVAVTCAGRGGWRRFELTREVIDARDGRIGFALKSRRLFWPLRESAFGRVARTAVRPLRHRQR